MKMHWFPSGTDPRSAEDIEDDDPPDPAPYEERHGYGHHPGELVRKIGPADKGWVFCANCYTYMRRRTRE